MKALKLLAIAAIVSMGLTACLKDKSAEQATEPAVEQPADAAAAPTDAAPAEGTTETPAQ